MGGAKLVKVSVSPRPVECLDRTCERQESDFELFSQRGEREPRCHGAGKVSMVLSFNWTALN